jgi:hypothetical protein
MSLLSHIVRHADDLERRVPYMPVSHVASWVCFYSGRLLLVLSCEARRAVEQQTLLRSRGSSGMWKP